MKKLAARVVVALLVLLLVLVCVDPWLDHWALVPTNIVGYQPVR